MKAEDGEKNRPGGRAEGGGFTLSVLGKHDAARAARLRVLAEATMRMSTLTVHDPIARGAGCDHERRPSRPMRRARQRRRRPAPVGVTDPDRRGGNGAVLGLPALLSRRGQQLGRLHGGGEHLLEAGALAVEYGPARVL